MSYSVKIISRDSEQITIGGYGVVFGGVDLDGDTFTKDTDFWADRLGTPVVLYQHGQDNEIKSAIIGSLIERKMDDVGLWVEAQLDLAAHYTAAILELVEKGALGWSSGAIGHLVSRDVGNGKSIVKSWPIVELSLTPTPAEPRTLGVERMKSLATLNPSLEAYTHEAGPAQPASDATAGQVEPETKISLASEDEIMSDETTETGAFVTRDELDTQLAQMGEAIKGLDGNLSGQLSAVMALLEKLPTEKKAGFITDGVDKETDIRSFGDFLTAIKRGDKARLAKVYKSTKDLAGTVGGSGGYIVPVDMRTDLLMVDPMAPRITSLVRRVQTSSLSGSYPALDQFVAPTAGAGDTAFAGGLTPATTAENSAMSEDNIAFEQIEWRVKKIGGYVDVPNELTADAPALETLLRDLFRIAIDAKLERHILRGSGGGQPLGIMNAACTIGVATATNGVFAEADALAMLARFLQVGNEPVWIMHRSVIPDLAAFTASDRDMVDWRGSVSSTLLGYPIIYSQHIDQANNDDVLLADLSAYLLFDRQDLTIDFSEHAKFETDQGVWRYKVRVDGTPWMKSAITDASPQGSFTMSPFVYHND